MGTKIRLRDADEQLIKDETSFLHEDLNARLAFILREYRKLKHELAKEQMQKYKNDQGGQALHDSPLVLRTSSNNSLVSS